MNNGSTDNYLISCSGVYVAVDSQHTTASPVKKSPAVSNAVASFQKSFKNVVADMKREKQQIGLKELQDSRLRQQEFMSRLTRSRSNKANKPTDQLDKQRKCLAIARRIMKGAKVTLEELRYLLENDPELYFMAMLMKQEKPQDDDDEEVELEDEETLEDEQLQSFEQDSHSAVSVTGPDCSAGMSAGAATDTGV